MIIAHLDEISIFRVLQLWKEIIKEIILFPSSLFHLKKWPLLTNSRLWVRESAKRTHFIESILLIWSQGWHAMLCQPEPQMSASRGISFIIRPVTSVELPLDTLLPIAMATEKHSVFLERAHVLDRIGLFKSEVFWCWTDGRCWQKQEMERWHLPFRDRNLVGRLIFLRGLWLDPEQSILSKLGKQNQWDETVVERMRSSSLSANVPLYYIPSSRVRAMTLAAQSRPLVLVQLVWLQPVCDLIRSLGKLKLVP